MEHCENDEHKCWRYICLDASDGGIENEILGKNNFCTVTILAAKSPTELDDDVLKEADIVALWHTIHLDDTLLRRLKKPPKVRHFLYIKTSI